MFASKDSNHLKLIDFGFSNVCPPFTRKSTVCGSLAYMAPEVLARSYTSQCDLWSLGVTVFIMVFGYMPFSGLQHQRVESIHVGKYAVKKKVWNTVSPDVQEFVKALLVVDPKQRLDAKSALEHRWIQGRDMLQKSNSNIEKETAYALVSFAAKTQFQRAAMHLMTWSLTNEEQATVRQAFIDIDTDRSGSITINELKKFLEERLHIDNGQAQQAFAALDSSHHEEIFYSEFLAAMVSSRIQMRDHLLHASFQRFDANGSGFITQEYLKRALGDSCPDEQISAIIQDLDGAVDSDKKDGKIDYAEFVAYFRDGNVKSEHQEAVAKLLDKQITQHGGSADLGPKGAVSKLQSRKMINDTFPCCVLQ